METLQVRTGSISLMILDDLGNERGVFTFNPNDISSARKMFSLQEEVEQKSAEFEKQVASEDIETRLSVLNEIVDYFEGLIDECFGEGSSAILFGNSKTLSMFEDFFNGITPYYQKASSTRVSKYKKATKK